MAVYEHVLPQYANVPEPRARRRVIVALCGARLRRDTITVSFAAAHEAMATLGFPAFAANVECETCKAEMVILENSK